jgi:hypothetical protein
MYIKNLASSILLPAVALGAAFLLAAAKPPTPGDRPAPVTSIASPVVTGTKPVPSVLPYRKCAKCDLVVAASAVSTAPACKAHSWQFVSVEKYYKHSCTKCPYYIVSSSSATPPPSDNHIYTTAYSHDLRTYKCSGCTVTVSIDPKIHPEPPQMVGCPKGTHAWEPYGKKK